MTNDLSADPLASSLTEDPVPTVSDRRRW